MNGKKYLRDIIDETIANAFSNKKYQSKYEFYFHLLAQCKIIMTDKVETAGVNFKGTKYFLYINPEFFDVLPLNQRLGVLVHEMLHILYNHLDRFPFSDKTINHKRSNIACDIAINQQISRKDLPEFALYPDTVTAKLKEEGFNVTIPKNENAETYYDLLPEKEGDSESGDGEPGEPGDGEPSDFYDGLWEDNPMDNHDIWEESKGDETLKQDLTKRMIEKSMEKSRGNVPSQISEYLDIWTRKVQISWKSVLRNIVSNKKANKVSTIMRKSRRFPNRPEVRGYKKDRQWDLITILDVSGSMSDEEIIYGLTEITEICRLTNSNMKIIQCDSNVQEVSEFDPSKKSFHRSASGGTEMEPAITYIKENNIKVDGIVLITDGYIEDISYWKYKPKVPIIFLTTEAEIKGIDDINRYRQFNLSNA